MSDSLVGSLALTPDPLYSGVTFSNSVNKPFTYAWVTAGASLTLAAAGVADSTAPVARGSISVDEYGTNGPPARRAQATLRLSLRYSSPDPVIYWLILFPPDSGVPQGQPGPPGDVLVKDPSGAMTNHPDVSHPLRGSVPNTGALPDIEALIETVLGSGEFGQWSGSVPFAVYLDNAEFTHPVLDVGPASTTRLELAAARPNPSRSGVALGFALPSTMGVELAIFDCTGRRVRSLANGVLAAGAHTATWNGKNERGERVGAGVYFARLTAGSDVLVRRIVLRP